MNPLEEALAFAFRTHGREILTIAVVLTQGGLVIWMTALCVNARWHKTIIWHMPAIIQREMDKRDRRVKELEGSLEEMTDERDQLRVKVRAVEAGLQVGDIRLVRKHRRI